jgi:hypothetical protein
MMDDQTTPGEGTEQTTDSHEGRGKAERSGLDGAGDDAAASPVSKALPPLKDLRVDPSQPIGGERLLVTVPVKRPENTWWFRVRPGDEWREHLIVVELRTASSTETYLALPNVAAIMGNQAKLVDMRLAITHNGQVFFWPVKQRMARENAWTETAIKAAALAEDHWIRMESADGHYAVIRAKVQIAEPIWPDRTFEELLGLAYRDDQIIRDEHHPVIGYLMRGEV